MPDFSSWHPLLRVTLRYGVVSGVIGFVIVLILYYTDHHPFLIPVFLDYRVVFFAIFFVFALREFRDFHNGGILYFWQGMIGTLTITVLFAIISSSAIYIFAKADPEFVESYISLSLTQVKSFSQDDIDRIGQDVYQAGIDSLKEADAYFLASRYFVQSFILSFFISIIISVILRRQPKLTDHG